MSKAQTKGVPDVVNNSSWGNELIFVLSMLIF
jgi:hypothetical protein